MPTADLPHMVQICQALLQAQARPAQKQDSMMTPSLKPLFRDANSGGIQANSVAQFEVSQRSKQGRRNVKIPGLRFWDEEADLVFITQAICNEGHKLLSGPLFSKCTGNCAKPPYAIQS